MDTLPYAESGWEHSIERSKVDEGYLRRHLEPWPDLIGQPWTLLSGGLRTTLVRIGEVVVRIDTGDQDSLTKEVALHRLVDSDLRVPRVLGAGDRVLLLEYVPHGELPASEVAGERVGRAAAAIHAHQFDHSGFLDARLEIPDPFPSAYDGLRAWGEEQIAHDRLAPWRNRILATWKGEEQRMRDLATQPVLLHADFKPANVKWLSAEDDVVVFDWEFAWSGPALMDLGQMIRWGVPDTFARGLERGYGELPDDWQRLGELFDLFNLIAFVADGDDRPTRTRDATARMETTLSRNEGE